MKKRSHYIEIDREVLYDLYWNRNKTLSDIAKYHMFCSHPTVINRMKELGIPRRPGLGRKPKHRPAWYNSSGEIMCPRCDAHLATPFQKRCRECGQYIK